MLLKGSVLGSPPIQVLPSQPIYDKILHHESHDAPVCIGSSPLATFLLWPLFSFGLDEQHPQRHNSHGQHRVKQAPSDNHQAPPYAAYLKTLIGKGVLQGQLPVVTTDPNLLEGQAQKFISKKGFDYIRGGAGESATMDANRLAFRQWKIVPRVLRPTSPRDLGVTLFGHKYGRLAARVTTLGICNDTNPLPTNTNRHARSHGPNRCSLTVPYG